jgi:hypothetical protein
MRSGQEQFDHAELLLYAAGELPDPQQQDLEQRLAVDADLRQQLDSLRSDHEAVFRGLADADAGDVIGSSAPLERLIGRAVRQRRVEERVAPVRRTPRARVNVGWGWVHTAGLAASVLVGLVCWWGLHPRESQLAVVPNEAQVRPDGQATAPPRTQLGLSVLGGDTISDDATLEQAENDLQAVAYLRSLTETTE